MEYELRDTDFRKIANLVMSSAGIVVTERKKTFIQGRLGRRLRALGLSDFEEYCRLLDSPSGEEERHNLINAVTTNHTSFFREKHHFDYLQNAVLPAIARDATVRRLRIWSAGCSSGEEPYTIAMVLRECRALFAAWDARILATDLDTNVLKRAADGVYDDDRLEAVPASYRKRYFVEAADGSEVACDDLRSMISFGQLNLLEPWPMTGPFDIIFFRNVVIYFDKPTQRTLFDRYAEMLKPDGWLFVGHSESLMGVSDRFELVGRTIYRRIR